MITQKYEDTNTRISYFRTRVINVLKRPRSESASNTPSAGTPVWCSTEVPPTLVVMIPCVK